MQDELLGGWRPVRWEWESCRTGQLLYATENLEGLLIYAADGTMSVRVRSTRKASSSAPPPPWRLRQTPLQWIKRLSVATPGYQWGYSGRYEIDEARSELLHHVELRSIGVSSEPILRRHFTLDADRLCLEYTDRGSRDRIHWRRAAARHGTRAAVSAQVGAVS